MPVHTKKDGRIFVVYRDPNRKRVWEAFGRGEEARRKAEIRDLQIKLAKAKGNFKSVGIGSAPTLTESLQAYLNARSVELSERTIDEIASFFDRYLLAALGNKTIDLIDMKDWDALQNKMIKAGAGARSINTYFSYLNAFFEWAVVHGYVNENPWRKRKRLKEKKYHVELMTMEEFQKILQVAPDHLAWSLEIAYHTGCRPGPKELFSLRWADVDWKIKAITIYAPKTDTYRVQYLSHRFLKRMKKRYRQQLRKYPDCPYICHYEGKRIGSLKTSWKTTKEEAGITRQLRLYDLRHYYITYALASGTDIMELAQRVGHTNASMIVNVYAHLAKDLRKREALSIPEYDFAEVSSRVPTPSETQKRAWQRKKARGKGDSNKRTIYLVDKKVDNKEKGVSVKSLTP
jgi:integrase